MYKNRLKKDETKQIKFSKINKLNSIEWTIKIEQAKAKSDQMKHD